MVFFLNAEDRVYARYAGRGPEGPDARQSLARLRYTMQSVLAMHERAEKSFAPKSGEKAKYIREFAGMGGKGGKGCMHCHQVRETLNAGLKRSGAWERESAW